MKVLMVDADSDNRLFALFAFKDLNVAHSIDFVNDIAELSDYFVTRLQSNSELPDLVLMDSSLSKSDKLDSLKEIRLNPKLRHLKIIAFSVAFSNNNSTLNVNASGELAQSSKDDELVWIFKEICDELVDKPGWEYLIERHDSAAKMHRAPQAVYRA
jgi:CheY-like chemotaxis protein